MKKFLVLLALVVLFIACDYAEESIDMKPDIECVYMNPIGWYTYEGDTLSVATIEEIHFVAENSVDSYLDRMEWEYYDEDSARFFGPEEMALYGKIEGRVDPECCDTFILVNISLPLQPVWDHLQNGESARALLHFYFVDEYYGTNWDTVTVWFGIYMMP